MMYEEADLQAVLRQRKRRWVLLLIPAAALLAAVIVGAATRTEWLASGATVVGGAVIIGGYDLFIKPLSDYAVHVNNMLHGRKREVELPFAAISDDISLVDGVRYHALTCSDHDAKGKPTERLFYFDAEKPFPGFAPGEMLRITFHDKEIAGVTRV